MAHRSPPASASRPAERSTPRPSESGFMLLAVIVMVALVLIALAVAAPVVARDLRRDKEVESIHRAQQYVRAIRLYQRKFPNQYPPSLEALEKTNNVRYLRKQYVDPLTGKADWRIIHVGENKTSVKGFFGEPLGGLDTKGLGGLGSAAGMQSGSTPCPPSGPINGLAGGFAPPSGGAGGSANCPTGPAGTGNAAAPTSPSNTSTFGDNGGVGPIMGVGSSRSGDSISTPNEQTTYDTWEFLYDPRIELLYKKGQLAAGVGGGGLGSTPPSGFGNGSGGSNPGGSGTGTSPGGAGSGGQSPGKP